MTLTSAPVLPPELVWLIVEHIWDWHTLRICALVSRTWAIPCQRALFHDLHLYEYTKMIRLPAHLIRYPHLQGFIQHVSVDHISWDIVTIQRPRDKYLSSLTALFPLISHITSLAVTFDRCHNWDTHDQQFVEAFSAFLRRSEKSLKVLVINGLLNKRDLQQMFSFLDSTQVRRLSLHTEFQPAPGRVDFFDSTLSIARLPAVEFLRIDSHDAFELQTGLNLWLGQHLAMFPNLKHLEIVVYDALNLHLWFSGILQPATLRLESFRLVLTRVDSGVLADSMPIYANLFDGLQFKHLQLHMLGPIDPYDAPDIIDWFSAMFRHLVEAGSTIHFTELTFTFTDVAGPEWGSVDDVLSHAAFRGVEHIHFEEESHYERMLISKLEHPELVSAIRDAFPRLASRGVLCFK